MNACVHTDTKPQISSTLSRGLGWRIHGSVEDTKLSTNKQHTLPFDQWDQALPHLCFGLNTHPSSATHVSPFEPAHGFPARVPLTLDLAAHARLTGDREAADYALVVHNRSGGG
jgi:hypothetical protein